MDAEGAGARRRALGRLEAAAVVVQSRVARGCSGRRVAHEARERREIIRHRAKLNWAASLLQTRRARTSWSGCCCFCWTYGKDTKYILRSPRGVRDCGPHESSVDGTMNLYLLRRSTATLCDYCASTAARGRTQYARVCRSDPGSEDGSEAVLQVLGRPHRRGVLLRPEDR